MIVSGVVTKVRHTLIQTTSGVEISIIMWFISGTGVLQGP